MKHFLRRARLIALIILSVLSLTALRFGLYFFCGHSNEVWGLELHSAFGHSFFAVAYDNMYFENMPYVVRQMEEGEDFKVADGKIPPDAIGKYRAEILFIDTDLGKRFFKRQTPSVTDTWGRAYDIKTLRPALKGKFKTLVTSPDDSLLCIYIGSEEPFEIEEKDGFLRYTPFGIVYIKLAY